MPISGTLHKFMSFVSDILSRRRVRQWREAKVEHARINTQIRSLERQLYAYLDTPPTKSEIDYVARLKRRRRTLEIKIDSLEQKERKHVSA